MTSHWRKNFLPYIRYVAIIPCESLRHKSNTFHTILALCTHLYRSHLRKPVSMKQKKTQQKVKDLKFIFKMSTIYANTCIQTTTPLRNRGSDDGMVQQPPLDSAEVLSTPSHHGSANGRPSLEVYPRCCSPPDSNLANWMSTSLVG